MANVYKADIKRALDEQSSNEDWLKFQTLAVILAKQKWPDLVASEPKKDLGADAYAPSSLSAEGAGKILACSLTATLAKIRDDATKIREHVSGVSVLIFATARAVTNQTAEKWAEKILKEFGYQLLVMSREDIVTSLMMPSNAPMCRMQLGMAVAIKESDVELVERTREATSEVTKVSGPMIEVRTTPI